MKKLAVAALGIAVTGVAAVAAPSGAQDPPVTTVTAEAHVTPDKPGTKKQPRGVKLKVDVRWDTPGDVEKPVVQRATVMFPKGSKYNGGKFPKCSANTMARKGINGCPKGSIMGKGSGKAMADDVPTYPRITIVNGGAKRVYFYTVMTNPARVQAPVVGKITKVGGRYSYKLQAQIPKSLQIVAGVPIVLHELTLSGGKGDWLATTSCPADKRWRYHAEGLFTTGETIVYDDSVPCR